MSGRGEISASIFFRTALSETGPDKPARAVLEETALHAGAKIKREETCMKKTLRKRILAGAAVVALLCGTAVAASTVTTKMIEANYMGIKIVVDGVEVTPKDANGKVVEPFASNGTTYLPVRAIGEALGKDVTWDGSTATVYVGDVPGQVIDWMKKLPPYQVNTNSKIFDGSDPKSYMTISGNKITKGVQMSGGYKNEGYASWNTNLKYESMTFTIGHVDGSKEYKIRLDVFLDGELSETYTVDWSAAPQTITIPLDHAANVRLETLNVEGTSGWNHEFGIYDISFS